MRISRSTRPGPKAAAYRLLTATLLALFLVACGGGGTDGDGDPPPVLPVPTGSAEGRLTFVRGEAASAVENEPNDDAASAQRLADAFPGQSTIIFGGLSGAGGDDTDAFRVRFPIRSQVVVSLGHPAATDFTLSLYDPLSMQFINSAPGPNPELRFIGRGMIDLVVTSPDGGRYELTLDVQVAPVEFDEVEPNNDAMTANVMGEIRLGESLTMNGNAVFGADALDAFLLSCPENAIIGFSLQIAAFSDTLLRISDATGGLGSPAPLLSLDGPPSVARTGSVSVTAGTLLLIEVVPESGGGAWRLTVNSQSAGSPKPFAGGAHALAPEPRVSMIDEEAQWFSSPPHYGIPGEMVVGQAIVCFCEGQEEAAQPGLASRGCSLLEEAPQNCLMCFDLPIGQSVEQQQRQTFARCCALAGDSCLRYAEPNYIRRPMAEPDDDLYWIQSWHYEMLNLPAAWDITTGAAGTTVAVLDTGRLNHPDLSARNVGGYDFVTGAFAGDGNGVDPNPDDHGVNTGYHGGHVAGTIGAVSNNSQGVAGVTWIGNIMPVRVLGDFGFGNDFDITQGIYYAARIANSSGTLPPSRADVINMSLGGGGFNSASNDACNAAKAAGCTIVCAAGNANSATPQYPASYSATISIVALDAQRNRAPYSSYGPSTTLSAPGGHTAVDTNGDGHGDGVMSTSRDASGATYTLENGTSMASPHAAGVVALLIAEDPTLTPSEIESILIDSAVDLGTPGFDNTFANGLIDAFAALNALVVVPPPPPTPLLDVTPRSVNFGATRRDTTVLVRNVGGDMLDVTAAVVTIDEAFPWLSAQLVGPASASSNVGGVEISVDRSGLTPGAYFGSIEVQSNGGTANISVLAQVVTSLPPPPNIDIFIRAISVDTGQVVQERVVNPSISLDYSFASLPIGEYAFIAGTDIDGDGEICEEGDFCGRYPSAGEPRTVLITRDFTRPNINFDVLRTTTVSTGAR